jgi:2-methylcitrate dehydratase
VFSTALAAARLMQLDEARLQQAVNIAGVRSASLRQSRVGDLSHWKACTVASAARHGVFAAILAAGGMTGPAPIFEGTMGFERLVSGGPLNPQIDRWASRGGGKDFMILKSSIKFWPAEIHSQTAIEAALKLQPQISDVDQIESVLIESHGAAVDIIGSEAAKWRPMNRETADHSLPYIVAVSLCDGELTTRQFSPDRIVDPKLLALTQRVKVVRHAELSANYPAAAGNIVTVFLKNNRRLSERVDYPRGHVRNPLTDGEIEGKFRRLAEPRLGHERAGAVLDYLWHLDEKSDLSGLMNLLRIESAP